MVTKKEAAVIETYTGVCMLVGDDRKYVYKYAENLVGRPVFTHELPYIADEFADKIKDDFIEICKNLTDEDIQFVVHAKWELVNEDENVYMCSNCGDEFITIEGTTTENHMIYCPFCGAKMDEKEVK